MKRDYDRILYAKDGLAARVLSAYEQGPAPPKLAPGPRPKYVRFPLASRSEHKPQPHSAISNIVVPRGLQTSAGNASLSTVSYVRPPPGLLARGPEGGRDELQFRASPRSNVPAELLGRSGKCREHLGHGGDGPT